MIPRELPLGIAGLLEELANTLEKLTEELRLPVNPDEYDETKPDRAPLIFKQSLPDRSDTIGPIPYIIVQLTTGEDKLKDKNEISTQSARILIAIYNSDGTEGGQQIIDLVERIRNCLEEGRLLAKRYMLCMPVEWEIYSQEDTGPYHIAEINTVWTIQQNRRIRTGIDPKKEQKSILDF